MKIKLSAVTLATLLLTAAAAFAAPEVSVEQGTYDFGSVTQGKKVQHSFTVKNSGDQPLQIRQMSASCGCTAAKPSSSIILPGRSAEIQVTFDSANFSGRVEKTVTMTTNAGRSPNYTFKLEGNVAEELQVAPRQLSLGPMAAGVAKQVNISVVNRGSKTVKVLTVSANSTSLDIRSTIKKAELKPGETGVIELAITARQEARILSGYVHITTNSPQKKEITIPVYGSGIK